MTGESDTVGRKHSIRDLTMAVTEGFQRLLMEVESEVVEALADPDRDPRSRCLLAAEAIARVRARWFSAATITHAEGQALQKRERLVICRALEAYYQQLFKDSREVKPGDLDGEDAEDARAMSVEVTNLDRKLRAGRDGAGMCERCGADAKWVKEGVREYLVCRDGCGWSTAHLTKLGGSWL
jgi:hypothetical protein